MKRKYKICFTVFIFLFFLLPLIPLNSSDEERSLLPKTANIPGLAQNWEYDVGSITDGGILYYNGSVYVAGTVTDNGAFLKRLSSSGSLEWQKDFLTSEDLKVAGLTADSDGIMIAFRDEDNPERSFLFGYNESGSLYYNETIPDEEIQAIHKKWVMALNFTEKPGGGSYVGRILYNLEEESCYALNWTASDDANDIWEDGNVLKVFYQSNSGSFSGKAFYVALNDSGIISSKEWTEDIDLNTAWGNEDSVFLTGEDLVKKSYVNGSLDWKKSLTYSQIGLSLDGNSDKLYLGGSADYRDKSWINERLLTGTETGEKTWGDEEIIDICVDGDKIFSLGEDGTLIGWIKDTVNPSIAYNSDLVFEHDPYRSYEISWNTNDANPQEYRIYQDGSLKTAKNWNGENISYVFGIAEPIELEFECIVEDISGNINSSTVTVTLQDTIAPTLTSFSYTNSSNELVFIGEDRNAKNYSILRNNEEVVETGNWNSGEEISYEIQKTGEYKVVLEDAGGNTVTSSPIQISVSGSDSSGSDFPWLLLIIILGIVIAVVLTALAILVYRRQRKKQEEEKKGGAYFYVPPKEKEKLNHN